MFERLAVSLGSWPFPTADLVFAFFLAWSGNTVLLLFGLTYILGKIQRKGKSVPTITPEMLVSYTFRRDAAWAKLYFYTWRSFPSDLCTYFWRSVVLIFMCVVGVIWGLLTASMAITLTGALGYLIFKVVLAIPVVIPSLLKGLAFLAMKAGSSTYNLPVSHQVLWGFGILIVLILFFRSQGRKVMWMRWKAFKERNCPLIRFE